MTPAKVSPTPLMLNRRSRFRSKPESLSIVCAMASSTASSWLVKCEIVTSAKA
jgi:hypothetical protein